MTIVYRDTKTMPEGCSGTDVEVRVQNRRDLQVTGITYRGMPLWHNLD